MDKVGIFVDRKYRYYIIDILNKHKIGYKLVSCVWQDAFDISKKDFKYLYLICQEFYFEKIDYDKESLAAKAEHYYCKKL